LTTSEQQVQDSGRILVVDDEIEDEISGAWMLVQLLESQGYRVGQATGFDDVAELMPREDFDLVSLDIDMPGKDGLQVLEWLQEHYPETGVVMATGRSDLDKVVKAMQLGAYDYLLKPFNIELVTPGIRRAMERQRLLAENRAYQLELEQKVEERTRELRQANQKLERSVKELEGRDRLVRYQMWEHTLKETCEEILQVISDVLEVRQIILYRPEGEAKCLKAAAALGLSRPGWLEDEGRLEEIAAVAVDDDAGLAAQAYASASPLCGDDGVVAVPVIYQDQAIGVIWVDGLAASGGEDDLNALWRFGQEAALVMVAAQMSEDLESGAVPVDELLDLE
jgi:DNA-binding response OmpR family regulator